MDAYNVATCFNVFTRVEGDTSDGEKRPELILMEMEWNNLLMEKVVVNAHEIFIG